MGLEGNMWGKKSIDGEWIKKHEADEIDYRKLSSKKDSYDCLFEDEELDFSLLEEIDDDGKAAIDAERYEAAGMEKILAESMISEKELWSASNLGKYTINTSVQEKQKVEEQDKYMQPVSELEFQEISDDADKEDIEMQKKFEEMAKELEGLF